MDSTGEQKDMNYVGTSVSKLKDLSRRPLVSKILKGAYQGLLVYVVIFIISEILISGGKSEQNPYFVAVIAIFMIALQFILIKNEDYTDPKSTITSAVSVTLTIAILDYLIVNLAFEKNNYQIYKYWPFYFTYLTTLALPFIRSNWDKAKLPNLKMHLTKKNRTL